MDNFQSQGVNSKNNNGAYPNDPKVWALSETSLKAFFVSSPQKIYQNFLGLVVYCAIQKTEWEWREYVVDETTTKLLDTNFTYPSTYPTINDIVYADKVYNFFKKPTAEEVLSEIPDLTFENIGDTGVGVFDSEVGELIKFRKIDSDDFLVTEVTTPTGKIVKINAPADTSFQGTDFYVNNNYSGSLELGTQARPFKTLRKCVDKILNRDTQNSPSVNGGDPYEKWDLRGVNQEVRVIIQSYTETLENLAINRVTYFLERGGFDSMIQLAVGSTSDRIIDMKELVDNVPKSSGKLPYDITCAVIGKGTVAIQEGHTTRKGYFRAFGHNNGIVGVDQPDSQLTVGDTTSNISCIMYKLPSISYINLTDDRRREDFIYDGSMPITVSRDIVSIDNVYVQGVLVDPSDYSFVNDEVTITSTVNPTDNVVIDYSFAPENIERELVAMLGNQTTSVPDYGAFEAQGANAIFGQSLFLSGDIGITCLEQHMIYAKNKGGIYGEEGSLYIRRHYQFVNYNTIEYRNINASTTTPNIKKFYTPSEHVSDIYLKNGSDFSYAGKFVTQENTGASQGGSEAFATVESSSIAEHSSFAANGGGVIFNLFYNHYLKVINHSSFAAYATSGISAKSLRMESAVFEEVISIVDESGADYTDLIYPLMLQNCTLQNKFVYGNVRMPFINMTINSNVFIRGGVISLVDTIMNSDTPLYANNAAAVAALMPIGSYYRDASGAITMVV